MAWNERPAGAPVDKFGDMTLTSSRNTPEERAAARLTVRRNSVDARDECDLVEVLGLGGAEGDEW